METARIPADTLRTVLALLGTQTEEATMTPSPENPLWWTFTASRNGVTMVRATLYAQSPGGEGWAVSVPRLLRAVKDGDEAVFRQEEGGFGVTCGRWDTWVPHLAPDTPARVPRLSHDAHVTVLASDLTGFVRAMEDGEVLTVAADPTGLTFSATDIDRDVCSLRLPPEETVEWDVRTSVRSTFRADEWRELLSKVPRNRTLALGLSTDYPCTATMTLQGAEVTWMTAPMLVS